MPEQTPHEKMGRCKHNLRKWKYTEEDDTTCDCKETDQTMEHLLECPLLRQTCSLDDLMVYNDVAKECVRQWIGLVLLLVVQRHLVGSQVITKCPPFDTVSTVQAVVETWHTWMIDNVHQIRIKCMLETIDRTRSGTSNKFWQGIK